MANTDPTELLKLHDQIIRIENEMSGLSEESVGVAEAPKHYVQFVENRYPEEGDWMNAYYYRTSYVKKAMKYVLDSEELKLMDGVLGMKLGIYISRHLGIGKVSER